MKTIFVKYIIILLIFNSCTNQKIVYDHWSKYAYSNSSSISLTASRNTVLTEPKLKLTKPLLSPQDSVKILTKAGKTHQGIITRSDFNGYYLKINNREIYISNNEIKEITFLNPNKTVLFQSSLKSVNKRPDITSTTKNDSQIKNEDVWDKTNDEFSNNINTVKPPHYAVKKLFEPFSVLSFVFTLLGFLTGFTFLLGIIFGGIGLSRIKQNPEKYKGKWLAKFSLIFSLTVIILALLTILLVLVIFFGI